MTEASQYALITTAVATALLHTLIPDHWLPFVLVGRARGWSVWTTAAVSGASGLLHVGLSIVLGLIALVMGVAGAEYIGESLERAGAALLIVFGVGYAWWSWRKGGHFHPGGAMLHAHESGSTCRGEEGDTNPTHLHYHADDELIAGRSPIGAVALAVIVGLNPCVLFMPLVLASADRGALAVTRIALAYSVPALVTMVGLSALGVAIGGKIPMPGAARHMESLSGLLIAALGVVLWLFEH